MKLDTLLKLLAASKSDELRIEPNMQPYFNTPSGNKNASDLTLTAATISAMIFPAIPVAEKMRLPNVPQISFKLVNEIGEFSIVVGKSAGGLNVTITKLAVNTSVLAQINSNSPAELTKPMNVEALVDSKPVANNNDANKPKSFLNSLQTSFFAGSKSKDQAAATETIEELHPSVSPASAAIRNPPRHAVIEVNNYHSIEADVELPDNLQSVFEKPNQVQNVLEKPNQAQDVQEKPIEKKINSNLSFANGQFKQKMDALFHAMAELKSSDLHMSVSTPPMVRKDGRMQVLDQTHEALTAETMRELLWSIMPEKNREEFERRHDTDFAYEIPGLARFRANIFMDRKGMGGVFRIIPSKILTAEQLGLSQAILDLCNLSKGLVVVTGPTGSGKSTTLCAMVDYINKKREDHIITIEDPIEFVHENQSCLVNQREVHNHTDSFKDALRAALREDPDILLVGEMRDLETISIAIETAETGHLVFGTLHTTTAPSTVDRIIDQFPADRQQQIRVMLSESLKGVIAQTLLPKKGGGRVAALEILIVTPAISNLIREGKTFQIASSMQTGKQQGMVVLNDALIDLVKKDLVEPRDAYIKAVDKAGFDALLKRNNISL